MQAETTVTYLDQELISSGSFHTLAVGPTTLKISYGGESISVDFIVSESPLQERNKIWGQVVSTDRLQIHILNFKQIMAPPALGPIDVGTMAGRPLSLVVVVTGVKDSECKHIAYSLYMGGFNG